jgi:hypothetical protein
MIPQTEGENDFEFLWGWVHDKHLTHHATSNTSTFYPKEES